MNTGYYKYFRWLSLDIVLGAVFFLAFLEQYYQVDLSFAVYFALASSIWLIYTCDHLIDGWKVQNPSSMRHRFHQNHLKRLIFIAGVVLILALVNVYYLPEAIIKSGALLSACCIGYLLLVCFFKKLWVKELLVALAYGVGIFLAPLTLKGGVQLTDIMLISELVLVAFLNLMIFSYYDAENDVRDGFNSLVLRFGLRSASLVIHSLALICIAASVILFTITEEAVQLLYSCMSALLYSLHILPGFYRINERFRLVGDGVFYLSAILLLMYL